MTLPKSPVETGDDSQSLEDRIRETIRKLGYAQLNSLNFSTENGMIVVSGELDSFYLKQVAQSVAINIAGIDKVQNEIQVN